MTEPFELSDDHNVVPFPQQHVGELVDADGDGNPDVVDRDGRRHDALDAPPAEDLIPAPERAVVDQGPVLDAELVDDTPSRPVDVQGREQRSAMRTALVHKASRRQPVVPLWIRDPNELRFVLRWLIGHAQHVTAYHAVRSPLYLLHLTIRSPLGAWKALVAVARTVFDAEGQPLRDSAVRRDDHELYVKLAHLRQERVRARLIVAGVAGVLVLALVLALVYLAPGWLPPLVLAGVVAGLGWLGAPADKPIVGPAVVDAKVQRLTSEQVIRALTSLGIGAMNAKSTIDFPAPIMRDGPGWRAEVDLPFGVTAGDVIERRDRLAAGLRRPLGCCWPEPISEAHPGRLVVWCGDEDMAKARQPAWPLRRASKASMFDTLPFGTDQRGRPVGIDLMYANLLIGALPGAGKTFALRVIVLGAAMDASCELRLFELKGTGDLDALEPISHHYGSGADDATAAACLASLREVYADLETRAATIKRLAKTGRAPENKIIPDLAANRALGLWPLLFVIDECQELFSHPEYGKEAAALCTAIIKRGRALGVILALATQRPDTASLPKAISDNVGIRFCLRVMGQPANDMILGTSSYQVGLRATMFRPSDKGIGYLVGARDDPIIVRGYYLDGDAAKEIIRSARVLRERAGTLSGTAVGEQQQVVDVLTDVFSVAGDAERLWSSVILDRLGQYRPDIYGQWTPEALAAALRPFGGRPEQVWGKDETGAGANRQGYVITKLSRGDGP